jgi:uncharacterized protein (TIGR01319 family)
VTRRLAVCADVGSTFTKVAVVDLEDGSLVATGGHRTTVDSDVLDGLDGAIAAAVAHLPGGVDISTVHVCSSAGGGLRLAVVGYEELVTAEAGHRVGLSAGARIVHVAAGELDRVGVDALRAARPDVVLLVGGTDGGDDEVLRHNAAWLARARLRVPVVVAGNIDARDGVAATLRAKGTPVVLADNVLPRIGELNPQPARAAIREVFLRHVIGGKRLSRGPRFASLVRGATPDVVLTAVELLAEHMADQHLAGDLVVIDVGGATTDVYSVLSPDPYEPAGAASDVAGTLWRGRTVEGDLGMRWSAPGVVESAILERLLEPDESERLAAGAAARAADPAFLPTTESDRAVDARFAQLAATVAVRRHARGDSTRPSGGVAATRAQRVEPVHRWRRDMRRVRLVVGSGGVLRHATRGDASAALGAVLADHAGGWALPRAAAATVDLDYVLAPAGLLAAEHPAAAIGLLRGRLLTATMVG